MEQMKQEVKFDWFSSSEDDIREEVARILRRPRSYNISIINI